MIEVEDKQELRVDLWFDPIEPSEEKESATPPIHRDVEDLACSRQARPEAAGRKKGKEMRIDILSDLHADFWFRNRKEC